MDEFKCLECGEKKTLRGIVPHIFKAHNLRVIDYYHKHLLKESEGVCAICSEPTKFISINKGYSSHCKKCKLKVVGVQKGKQTKLERYGNSNYNNLEKNKQTKEKKYGDAYYNNKDLIKSTMHSKYGGYTLQSKDLRAKVESTKAEKHGDKNFNNPAKRKETCIEKYGVDNAMKLDSMKQHLSELAKKNGLGFSSDLYKSTILSRYGVDNISKNPDIRAKIEHKRRATIFKRLQTSERFKNITPLFTGIEYINVASEYPFKCTDCTELFHSSLVNGIIPRCPKCFPYTGGTSKGEKEVANYVRSILPGIEVLENVRGIIGSHELDVFIPSLSIAIEYNGLYWHSERVNSDKKRHVKKLDMCESQGIHLIQIWEDDWFNKCDIVKKRLLNILSCNDRRIHARKCVIKEISSKTKDAFLEEYHLQGADKSKVKLGAFYNGELVAVMTFGGLRRALGMKSKINEYELYRYCVVHNIPGISTRLLKYFIKEYNPTRIVSFANRDWTNIYKNVYLNIGFKLVGISAPNYWYFNAKEFYKRHRYSFRKQVLSSRISLFDSTLTEWQNMQMNGYNRVWDSGNCKFEMDLTTGASFDNA